jgi:hypothetical protein
VAAVGVSADVGVAVNGKKLNRECVAVGVAEDELNGDATEREEGGKWRDPICEKRCAKRGIMRNATFFNRILSCSLDIVWYTLPSGIPDA